MRYLLLALAAVLPVSTVSGVRLTQHATAPAFELVSLNGRPIRLADYRGKVVLLNFWATWCGPCRVEMPWLAEFDAQYRSQGLEIVGISMDDEGSDAAVRNFVKKQNVNYVILKGNASVAAAYGGARFLPQTFLIGRDGRILTSLSGLQERKELEKQIRRALGVERAGPGVP